MTRQQRLHIAALQRRAAARAQKVQAGTTRPPADVTHLMTPAELAANAKGQADLAYAPQQSQIRGLQTASGYRANVEIPAYYKDYEKKAAEAIDNVHKAYGAAQDAVGGLINQSAQQDTEMAKALQGEGGAAADDRAIRSSAARRLFQDSFGAMIAAQGANAQNYQEGVKSLGALTGRRAQDIEGNRGRSYDQQMNDLLQRKGEFTTKTQDALRDNERKFLLEAKAFNLNVDKAREASQPKPADPMDEYKLNYLRRHGYLPPTGPPKKQSSTEKINEAKLKFFNKHGYWPESGPPKKPGSMKPSDVKSQLEIDFFRKHGYWPPTGPPANGPGAKPGKPSAGTQKALSTIGNVQTEYQRHKGIAKDPGLQHDVADSLRKQKVPPLLLNIGSALATRGYLTRSDVAKLKAAYPGIPIPKSWPVR